MSGAAPLRFLGVVLGGWVAVRAALLAPDLWPVERAPSARIVERASASPARPGILAPPIAAAPPARPSPRLPAAAGPASASAARAGERDFANAFVTEALGGSGRVERAQNVARPAPLSPARGLPFERSAPSASGPSRWSVLAWALLRRGEGRQLAAGGLLGGSQAGLRATYRLREGLALSGRVSAPVDDLHAAEAALGIEWQPLRSLPVRLLAERRQAIGREGRSAFAVLAHGGVNDRRIHGPVMLDAYGQAGMVGLKSRDGFFDGAVRVGIPVAARLHMGLGAWAAAQPGVSRVDIGPQASYRLPALGRPLRLSAEWRVRVAGDALPGSGPALTLSTDF
jgi:hypothetical protein